MVVPNDEHLSPYKLPPESLHNSSFFKLKKTLLYLYGKGVHRSERSSPVRQTLPLNIEIRDYKHGEDYTIKVTIMDYQ